MQSSAEIIALRYMPIPPGWESIQEEHPVRINGMELVVEHLTCTLEAWEADPELRASFLSSRAFDGFVQALRIRQNHGTSRLHIYDPGRN